MGLQSCKEWCVSMCTCSVLVAVSVCTCLMLVALRLCAHCLWFSVCVSVLVALYMCMRVQTLCLLLVPSQLQPSLGNAKGGSCTQKQTGLLEDWFVCFAFWKKHYHGNTNSTCSQVANHFQIIIILVRSKGFEKHNGLPKVRVMKLQSPHWHTNLTANHRPFHAAEGQTNVSTKINTDLLQEYHGYFIYWY